MRFTFRQLEVFVEAAQDCNFRKTAERLGVSQPSVSNQIRVLERWAGGELFLRTRGSTPRLSSKGAEFLDHARQLVAGRRQVAALERAPVRKERLRLRVAAGPWLLDRYIRPALPRFIDSQDDIVLHFLPPGAALHMRSAVRNEEADIAVFTTGRSARRLPGAELICEIPCSLYGSVRFGRLAAKDPAAIGSFPFILPPEGSDLERWMLRTLERGGVVPRNVIAHSQFADVIEDMVTSGKGVSVLFDEQMTENVKAGRACRLGPRIESASRMLVIGPRARSRAAAPFVKFLRRVLKQPENPARRAHDPR
jgi:DNA-binding transcriptional LysR family regulator